MKPHLSENRLPFLNIACTKMILPATGYNTIFITFKSLFNEIENRNTPVASKLKSSRFIPEANLFMMFNKTRL